MAWGRPPMAGLGGNIDKGTWNEINYHNRNPIVTFSCHANIFITNPKPM